MNYTAIPKISCLHEELKNKLVTAEAVKKNQDIYLRKSLQQCQTETNEKVQQSLHELHKSIDRVTKLYRRNSVLPKGEEVFFFYQQPPDQFFSKEETFTNALTEYTRKQFFEGIADFAGARDQSRYEILDVSKPESLLIKGENEEIRLQDHQELQRLQLLYIKASEKRLNVEMSYESMKRAAEIAEKQLHQLQSNTVVDISDDYLKNKALKLSEETVRSKKKLVQTYEHELFPLLNELQQLQSTNVLKGNYDLKIARQDYFLSKQNEVINQLLLQFSRNYLLTTLYEIELKEHRNSYHLIASSKSILENEIEFIQKRIKNLSDPILAVANENKETITSKDHFVNKLYDSIDAEDREELYKTYDAMLNEATKLFSSQDSVKTKYAQMQEEQTKILDSLETCLKDTSKLLSGKKSFSNEHLSEIIQNLEENLSMAEMQVNDTIKDIVGKRKILSSDSFKVLERTLFPAFFNDPTRLKRILQEMQSRVNAYASSS